MIASIGVVRHGSNNPKPLAKLHGTMLLKYFKREQLATTARTFFNINLIDIAQSENRRSLAWHLVLRIAGIAPRL